MLDSAGCLQRMKVDERKLIHLPKDKVGWMTFDGIPPRFLHNIGIPFMEHIRRDRRRNNLLDPESDGQISASMTGWPDASVQAHRPQNPHQGPRERVSNDKGRRSKIVGFHFLVNSTFEISVSRYDGTNYEIAFIIPFSMWSSKGPEFPIQVVIHIQQH